MANRERGEITFTVGEKDYVLKLTTRAMAELEDACSTPETKKRDGTIVPARDMTFPEILNLILRGSRKYMRLYIWASMLEKQPTTTVAQVEALIDEVGGIDGMWDVLTKVNQSAQPDPEDTRPQTAQATTRKRGTGGRSTSEPVTSA